MRWLAPAHNAGHSSLKLENDTNSGVESAKIVGHCGEIEAGSLRECRVVCRHGNIGSMIVFGRDDLLK